MPTDQKVTGLSPVGVTLKTSHLQRCRWLVCFWSDTQFTHNLRLIAAVRVRGDPQNTRPQFGQYPAFRLFLFVAPVSALAGPQCFLHPYPCPVVLRPCFLYLRVIS